MENKILFDKSALTDIAVALGFRSKEGFLYSERDKKFIVKKNGKRIPFLSVVGFQKGKIYTKNQEDQIEEVSY